MAIPGSFKAGKKMGETLRSIRLSKKLTLKELSAKSGIALSTLSKMETGQSSLSYDKLLKLTDGLQVDLTRLLADDTREPSALSPSHSNRRSITRATDREYVRTAPYDYSYPAIDLLQKAFTPMIVEARVRTIEEFGDLIRHPGEEFALVLLGSIVFYTDTYAPEILKRGDSVYFDSGMGHAYLAGSDERCVVLCVNSLQNTELLETRPAIISADLEAKA